MPGTISCSLRRPPFLQRRLLAELMCFSAGQRRAKIGNSMLTREYIENGLPSGVFDGYALKNKKCGVSFWIE